MYFHLIVDENSRVIWVAMLKAKSNTLREFKHFKALIEVEKNSKIQCLWSDRGGEFVFYKFNEFCVSQNCGEEEQDSYVPS